MSDRLGRNPFNKNRPVSTASVAEGASTPAEIIRPTELEGELIDLPENDAGTFGLSLVDAGKLVRSVLRSVLGKR